MNTTIQELVYKANNTQEVTISEALKTLFNEGYDITTVYQYVTRITHELEDSSDIVIGVSHIDNNNIVNHIEVFTRQGLEYKDITKEYDENWETEEDYDWETDANWDYCHK